MRALDFILENTEILDEVAMNPARLKQEAAKTGAQAGMEFEMIVPNVESEDEDADAEPDYDSDESANSFNDIREFFYDGEYNDRRSVDRLMDEISEEYYEWAGEIRSERWQEAETEAVKEYIEANDFDYDAEIDDYLRDELNLDEQQIKVARAAGKEGGQITSLNQLKLFADENEAYAHYAEARDHVDKLLDEKTEEAIKDQDRNYDRAREEWEDNEDWPDEGEWLSSKGYDTMQDIANNFDITWPHWQYPSGGEFSIDDVADEFSRMIGKPINASQRYHGARREAGHYVVEPDGSLDPDDTSDAGLEFVSPPMPIDEMLSDFNKVVAWAKKKGCYTNESTGLHINVSVPDYSRDKLDYVKLALLLGDEYVLKEFDRESNTFTKSALKQVKDNIRENPANAKKLLDGMKDGLSDIASKLIHSGTTHKYTSINTKDGYIEFRSPGGDWLDADIPKIENTLLRFVVALDAAVDPQKYRKEYLKKLYKLLAPSKDNTDTIQYFAKYAAGDLPKSALRSFVQQAQIERKVKSGKEDNKKYWWNVGRPGYGASVNLVASSKEEAIEKGKKEYPDWARATNMTATPIKPYEEPTTNNTAPQQATTGETQDYKIYRAADNSVVHTFQATSIEQAREKVNAWLEQQNIDRRGYGFSRMDQPTPTQQGSTQDLQRQRAAGGAFTGAWKVLADGQEVYRFSGVGNAQSDANRVAVQWLRSNGYGQGTDVEVVPIMS